jgi:hypothetical protein
MVFLLVPRVGIRGRDLWSVPDRFCFFGAFPWTVGPVRPVFSLAGVWVVYRAGFQPLVCFGFWTWGFAPGWYGARLQRLEVKGWIKIKVNGKIKVKRSFALLRMTNLITTASAEATATAEADSSRGAVRNDKSQ